MLLKTFSIIQFDFFILFFILNSFPVFLLYNNIVTHTRIKLLPVLTLIILVKNIGISELKKRLYQASISVLFSSARGAGIEPALKVLETLVLPLYEPRIFQKLNFKN